MSHLYTCKYIYVKNNKTVVKIIYILPVVRVLLVNFHFYFFNSPSYKATPTSSAMK